VQKLLILDNHDSFTYNLVQLIEQQGQWDFDIRKNNEISLEEVDVYHKILLSPGPGLPSEAGIMPELLKKYVSQKSILGVCLGHHAIAETFGGELYNFKQPVHGMVRKIRVLEEDVLFQTLPPNFEVGLYHSWAVSQNNFPEELKITAISEKGVIMALQHKIYDIRSVQFHPESIMTAYGKDIIYNWLES